LPDAVAEKLVSSWLDHLASHPEEHDKVEFNVAVTALTFDLQQRLRATAPGLSEAEEEYAIESYRDLTAKILFGDPSVIDVQMKRVVRMDRQRREILDARADEDDLAIARQLLRECVSLGTPAFSILARCGFIAEGFLRSGSALCEDLNEIMTRLRSSVTTVLTQFLRDLQRVSAGDLDEKDFMAEFGHLRPGTYDILALRYDQRSDLAQVVQDRSCPDVAQAKGKLSSEDLGRIERALRVAGLSGAPDTFANFVRGSIAGREYSKLLFTRNLSDALELISSWGERNGLSREELSFLTIDQILGSLSSTSHQTMEEKFRSRAHDARSAYEISQAIRLPYLISDISDAHVIPLLKSRANFITQRRTEAPVCLVTGRELEPLDAAGKIVLIERADPGYEWVFLTPIAGLITRFGGSNSHMAIRCAELSIPAAIGCGEQVFETLIGSNRVLLDCAAGTVRPVA
jgi:phosphohistidine swiveling domain-containing protein